METSGKKEKWETECNRGSERKGREKASRMQHREEKYTAHIR